MKKTTTAKKHISEDGAMLTFSVVETLFFLALRFKQHLGQLNHRLYSSCINHWFLKVQVGAFM